MDLAKTDVTAAEHTKSYQDWLLLRRPKVPPGEPLLPTVAAAEGPLGSRKQGFSPPLQAADHSSDRADELAAAGDTSEPIKSFIRFRYFLESGELANGYTPKAKATVKALMAGLQADDDKGRKLSVHEIDSRAAQARAEALDVGLLLADAMTAAALDSSPLRTFLRGLEPALWFDGLWTNWTELRPVLEQLAVRLQEGLLAPGETANAPVVPRKPDDGEPFYKPKYFLKWHIGDELLRRNATNETTHIEGKVRRIEKRSATGKGKRPVYWYSEPDVLQALARPHQVGCRRPGVKE